MTIVRMSKAASVIAVSLTLASYAARAAEPPAYGPVIQVHEYLIGSRRVGEPVAILGFPICSDIDECRLLAGRDYVSPRITFSAVKLEPLDQERLLHCKDPERGAKPCVIVLYGDVMRGRSVAPQRIEWRTYD